MGIHSNGTQLCVADKDNQRVLIWNTMPIDSEALPDIVLGQENFINNGYFNTNQRMRSPQHCLFVDNQLLVADTYNNREHSN